MEINILNACNNEIKANNTECGNKINLNVNRSLRNLMKNQQTFRNKYKMFQQEIDNFLAIILKC